MVSKRTPLILVSGFLGSGKTTLLNYLLRNGLPGHIGIILNDFGRADLDTLLVPGGAANVLQLSEGCACCTLATGFAGGIGKLLDSGEFDCLYMEASGTTSIVNLRRTLEWPTLAGRVKLERIVAVVEASRFPAYHRQLAIVNEQVQYADLVIINRCDLASPDQIQATRETIAEINSAVPVLATVEGRVGYEEFMEPGSAALDSGTSLPGPGIALPDDTLSCRIHLFTHMNRTELDTLLRALPDSLLRVKGFVKAAGEGILRLERVAGHITIEPCRRAVPADKLNMLEALATPALGEALDRGIEDRLGIRIQIDHAPHDPASLRE